MDFTDFTSILSANGILIDSKQIEIFECYHKELLYWNDKVNLISRQDVNNIIEKHFIHSLSILKYVNIPLGVNCLDIGTGGGFPGLPLKIARPDIRMLLSDSIKKKIEVTKIFSNLTQLPYVSCVLGRTEDLRNTKKYNKYFDIITSRAVAKTIELIDWTLPLIKSSGIYIFLKGGDLAEEINQAKKKYNKFIFEVKDIDISGCDLLNTGEKKIVIVHK